MIPYQRVQSRQLLSHRRTAETTKVRRSGPGLRLLKVGGGYEPYTANTLTIRLPWRGVACEGIEGMAIILALVSIRIHHDRQFSWQLGGTGGCA